MSALGRIFDPRPGSPYLFDARTDWLAFGGSAALALALIALGAQLGLLDDALPEALWIGCILAVDVAHVWTTAFRVYLDPAELRRRPLLYGGAPLALLVLGVCLHAVSSLTFYRALAYAAVFHFVRQQAGFLSLYHRREPGLSERTRRFELATIYTATLFPLAYWHAHLPRAFAWFVPGDFVPLGGAALLEALSPYYHLLLVAFLARIFLYERDRLPTGKLLLVTSTWAMWWLGIIALDSDYAFAVTNVLGHGIPYMVLTYRYGRSRAEDRGADTRFVRAILGRGVLGFALFALGLAFAEELLWDRLVYHERAGLFGAGLSFDPALLDFVVPFLSLPQLTHYVLDGFIWRRNRQASGSIATCEYGDGRET